MQESQNVYYLIKGCCQVEALLFLTNFKTISRKLYVKEILFLLYRKIWILLITPLYFLSNNTSLLGLFCFLGDFEELILELWNKIFSFSNFSFNVLNETEGACKTLQILSLCWGVRPRGDRGPTPIYSLIYLIFLNFFHWHCYSKG